MSITAHQKLRVIWERLFPIDRWRDPEALRQAGRIVAFDLAMFFWVVLFAPIYAVLGSPSSTLILVTVGVILPAVLVLLQRGYSPTLCGNILLLRGMVHLHVPGLRAGRDVRAVADSDLVRLAADLRRLHVRAALGRVLDPGQHCRRDGLCGGRSLWLSLPEYADPLRDAIAAVFGAGGPDHVRLRVGACSYAVRAERSPHATRSELPARAQSSLDSLTAIANRRSFDWTLEREWKRHERAGMPLSVALIDVDWFKQYNDAYGHLAGDDVLRSIAFAIQSGVHRPGDFAARFGGEEFAVILSDTDEHQAAVRDGHDPPARGAIEIPYPDPSKGPFVTISIGIATTTPCRGESFMELVHEADVALYQAKAEGRDRAIHASRMTTSAAVVKTHA